MQVLKLTLMLTLTLTMTLIFDTDLWCQGGEGSDG